MKLEKILIALSICFSCTAFAQNNDPIVMKLGDEDVYLSEFKKTFSKNNSLSNVSKQDADDYIELYTFFRLKYAQALALKLDTMENLKRELVGYREQAAAQYLTDKEVTEQLVDEALARMKWDIRASHILVKLSPESLPKDTLLAYNKIMKIRERIIKGEDFATVAKEESDDPSAKDKKSAGGELIQPGNKGDLGYFTAFDLIYSFENQAYNTPIGTISMPVRTEFGYHIIKVIDKRPALGKLRITQILLPFDRNANINDEERAKNRAFVENRIKIASKKIKDGADFDEVRSGELGPNTGNNDLPLFGCNRFEGDFIEHLYGLKVGQVSEPIRSSFGWHIVKVVELVPVDTNQEARAMVKSRIVRDSRSNKSKESFIERVKKENKFTEFVNKKTKKKPIEDFYTELDNSIFEGNFRAEQLNHLNKNMFSFAGKIYTQHDFANHLEKYPFKNMDPAEKIPLINYAYKRFIGHTVTDYEDSILEKKYPEFADLMNEYKEGILLYELNEQKVWKKAETDSIGLENFYQSIKGNHLYPIRIQAIHVKCVDAVSSAKAEKMLKKGTATDVLLSKMNKKNVTTVADTVIYWNGQNKAFDALVDWGKAATGSIFVNNEEHEIVKVMAVLQPSPKPLKEIRGVVISQYQNYLEEQWKKELLKNNKVWVDRETIYKNLQ